MFSGHIIYSIFPDVNYFLVYTLTYHIFPQYFLSFYVVLKFSQKYQMLNISVLPKYHKLLKIGQNGIRPEYKQISFFVAD